MFSDFGCPYDDYGYQQQPYYAPEQGNYQQQPSYQPEQDTGGQGGEAEQPSGAEENPSVTSQQPQGQSAPFTYETPLPDVIEWGKAAAAPEKQPVPSGKGPLIVNLPHHALTILLNEPSSVPTDPPPSTPSESH